MLKILLSRTDKIGDVILTLPMAGILKSIDPTCEIYFLGKTYTEEIIRSSKHIDTFLDWDKLQKEKDPTAEIKKHNIDIVIHVFPNKHFAKIAKDAKIPIRVGTSRRFFHLFYCNYLTNLSRKKSLLHEAQLNLLLLNALKKVRKTNLTTNVFKSDYLIDKKEIYKNYGFSKVSPFPKSHPVSSLIDPQKINLIFHPKSGGSAHEWPPENFIQLSNSLPKEKFNIFFSGTESEKDFINSLNIEHVHNIAGLLNLREFIQFINICDGLIAASTGPLHIAAALGKFTIGFYPDIHTMHPRRWGALGSQSHNFTMKDVRVEDISQLLQNNF